jgi:magnesium transporter
MAVETVDIPLKYQFLEILQSGNLQALHGFLDDQNISDVAELINEFPEHEGEILGNLVFTGRSAFKILISLRKSESPGIIPSKTARLLNGLQADDQLHFLKTAHEVVRELIRTLDRMNVITLPLLGYPEAGRSDDDAGLYRVQKDGPSVR